jgi:hypothetical protein
LLPKSGFHAEIAAETLTIPFEETGPSRVIFRKDLPPSLLTIGGGEVFVEDCCDVRLTGRGVRRKWKGSKPNKLPPRHEEIDNGISVCFGGEKPKKISFFHADTKPQKKP